MANPHSLVRSFHLYKSSNNNGIENRMKKVVVMVVAVRMQK
jgi:hypothetical protein